MAKRITPRNAEQHDKAHELFIAGRTQKVICEQLSINPRTLKRWIDDGVWREKRAVKEVSPDALIIRLMTVADEIINDEDFKEKIVEESNALARVIRQIKMLKNGTTINDRVQTFLDFSNFLLVEVNTDNTLTDEIIKKINQLQNKYIRELCNKL